MNLITETKTKINDIDLYIKDLQECLEQPVSEDCRKYLANKLIKATKGLEYYSEVLKVLEKVKERES
ncbi:hypothetical protein [Clostridium beijerinckii]|uniref:hypothetical protein n=1 Tax=Clostridium beijerinckii TaxID=1520 RepID=UPI00232CA7E6|nr:hypothetical protein [Clostridium beijerinckii]